MNITWDYNRKSDKNIGDRVSIEFSHLTSHKDMFNINGLIFDRASFYNFEIIETCYNTLSNSLHIILECSKEKGNMTKYVEHNQFLINEINILNNIDTFVGDIVDRMKIKDLVQNQRKYWTSSVERKWVTDNEI